MATAVKAPMPTQPAPVAAPIAAQPVSTNATQERQANAIQVSLERNPAFYSHIGRRMLHGSGDNKPTFDEVVITGLGMATKTAIGAASLMERDRQAFIQHIETSYFSSARGPRRVPKITITMIKNPDAPVKVE